MNTSYFFKYCCKDPNFKFYAGINFEYHYDIKTKVVQQIIAHFEYDLKRFETVQENLFTKIKIGRFHRLLRHTR
jgi:hypothetical protein